MPNNNLYIEINSTRYTIKQKLGADGLFARAYCAESEQGNKVVFKFLHPSWLKKGDATGDRFVKQFIREAIILSMLETNRIMGSVRLRGVSRSCVDFAADQDKDLITDLVRKYPASIITSSFLVELDNHEDLNDPGDLEIPYLAIEFVGENYQSLNSLIMKYLGISSLHDGLVICQQFAQLLSQIHSLGLAYLDMKEEHIFWDGKAIKVIDWNASEIKASPEKQSEDIYLFGKIMFGIFTGKTYIDPVKDFKSTRIQEINLAGLVVNPNAETTLDYGEREKDIPFVIRLILERLLAIESGIRFISSSELVSALNHPALSEWISAVESNNKDLYGFILSVGRNADGKRALGLPEFRAGNYSNASAYFLESLYFAPSLESAFLVLESNLRKVGLEVDAGKVKFAISSIKEMDYAGAITSLEQSDNIILRKHANIISSIRFKLIETDRRLKDVTSLQDLEQYAQQYLEVLRIFDYQIDEAREKYQICLAQIDLLKRITESIEIQLESTNALLQAFKASFGEPPVIKNLEKRIGYEPRWKRARRYDNDELYELALKEAEDAASYLQTAEVSEFIEKLRLIQRESDFAKGALSSGHYKKALEHIAILRSVKKEAKIFSDWENQANRENASIKIIEDSFNNARNLINNLEWDVASRTLENTCAELTAPTLPDNPAFSQARAKINLLRREVDDHKKKLNHVIDALNRGELDNASKYLGEILSVDSFKSVPKLIQLDRETLDARRFWREAQSSRSKGNYEEAINSVRRIKGLLGELEWIDLLESDLLLEKNRIVSSEELEREAVKLLDGENWDAVLGTINEAAKLLNSLPDTEYIVNRKQRLNEIAGNIRTAYYNWKQFENLYRDKKFNEAKNVLLNIKKNGFSYPFIDERILNVTSDINRHATVDTLLSDINSQYQNRFEPNFDPRIALALFARLQDYDKHVVMMQDRFGSRVMWSDLERWTNLINKAENEFLQGKYDVSTRSWTQLQNDLPQNKMAQEGLERCAAIVYRTTELNNVIRDSELAWSDPTQGHAVAIEIINNALSKFPGENSLVKLKVDIEKDKCFYDDIVAQNQDLERDLISTQFIEPLKVLGMQFREPFSHYEIKTPGILAKAQLQAWDKLYRDYTDAKQIINNRMYHNLPDDNNEALLDSNAEKLKEALKLIPQNKFIADLLQKLIEKKQSLLQKNQAVDAAWAAIRSRNYTKAKELLSVYQSDSFQASLLEFIERIKALETDYDNLNFDSAKKNCAIVDQHELLSQLHPAHRDEIKSRCNELLKRERIISSFEDYFKKQDFDEAARAIEKLPEKNDPWIKDALQRIKNAKNFKKVKEQLGKKLGIYIQQQIKKESGEDILREIELDGVNALYYRDTMEVKNLLDCYFTFVTCWDAYHTGELPAITNALKKLGTFSIKIFDTDIKTSIVSWQKKLNSLESLTQKINQLVDARDKTELLAKLNKETYLSEYLLQIKSNAMSLINHDLNIAIENADNALINKNYKEAIKWNTNAHALAEKLSYNDQKPRKLDLLVSKFRDTSRALVIDAERDYRKLYKDWEQSFGHFLSYLKNFSLFSDGFSDITYPPYLEEDISAAIQKLNDALLLDANIDDNKNVNDDLVTLVSLLTDSKNYFSSFTNPPNPSKVFAKPLPSLFEKVKQGLKSEGLQKRFEKFDKSLPVFLNTRKSILFQTENAWSGFTFGDLIKELGSALEIIDADTEFALELQRYSQDAKAAKVCMQETARYFLNKEYKKYSDKLNELLEIRDRYKSLIKDQKALPANIAIQLREAKKIIADTDYLYANGSAALKSGSYQRAKSVYDKIMSINPKSEEALTLKMQIDQLLTSFIDSARKYTRVGDKNSAIKLYKHILILEPENSEALLEIKELNKPKMWWYASMIIGSIILAVTLFIILRPVPTPPPLASPTPTKKITHSHTPTQTLTITPTIVVDVSPSLTFTDPTGTPTSFTPTFTPTLSFTNELVFENWRGITRYEKNKIFQNPPFWKQDEMQTLPQGIEILLCGSYVENSYRGVENSMPMYLVSRKSCLPSDIEGWIRSIDVVLDINLTDPILAQVYNLGAEVSTYSDKFGTQSLDLLKDGKQIWLCKIGKDFSSYSTIRDCNFESGWIKSNQLVLIIPPVESQYFTPTPSFTPTGKP